MGEMAEYFLSTQDDIDYFDSEGLNYHPMCSFYGGNRYESHFSKKDYMPKSNDSGRNYWINKDAEIIYVKDMSDKYLDNLVKFLCDNPKLLKQNQTVFEKMIEERYKRKKGGMGK